MRVNTLKIAAVTVMTGLGLQAGLADDQLSQQQHQNEGSALQTGDSSQHKSVRLSKLMDADVKSRSGEDLGEIEDVVINPSNGQIQFVVLGKGGFLGINEKRVPVPWQALNVQSEGEFTVNVDRQKLQSAPSVDQNMSQLNDPDYAIVIYRFYAVPAATGGSEATGETDTDTGEGSEPSKQQLDQQFKDQEQDQPEQQ